METLEQIATAKSDRIEALILILGTAHGLRPHKVNAMTPPTIQQPGSQPLVEGISTCMVLAGNSSNHRRHP